MSTPRSHWAVRGAGIVTLLACGPEQSDSDAHPEWSATETRPSPAEENGIEWKLQKASDSLAFVESDDARAVAGGPIEQSVRLADGGVLAAFREDRPYEQWTFFLELQPCVDGWCLAGVGYFLLADFGMGWVDVGGRVLVNAKTDMVHCRIELTTEFGSSHDRVERDFRVQPDADSSHLREWMTWWGSAGPMLRVAR